ncbi:hypothetical protein LguiA_022600 [Lonicera macranthoides]
MPLNTFSFFSDYRNTGKRSSHRGINQISAVLTWRYICTEDYKFPLDFNC